MAAPTSTSPRPFVFVLMPFGEAFDDTYRLAIKPACERAGAYAERVDEQIFQGSILERIYNQIAKADIVVADLTGRNANVFYETGYAHALGRLTLLLTREADDIPFDLKHYPHVVYGGKLSDLLPELERRVRWHLENPDRKPVSESILAARVNGVPLGHSPTIDVRTPELELRVDIHNTIGTEIRTRDLQVGLFTAKLFAFSSGGGGGVSYNVVSFSEEQNLHLPGATLSLLPGGWQTIHFYFGNRVEARAVFAFTLRIFSESGFIDLPFAIRMLEA